MFVAVIAIFGGICASSCEAAVNPAIFQEHSKEYVVNAVHKAAQKPIACLVLFNKKDADIAVSELTRMGFNVNINVAPVNNAPGKKQYRVTGKRQ